MNEQQSIASSEFREIKNPAILIDVAEQFESERLIFRCPLPGDGPRYYDFATECFDDTKRWFASWAKESLTPAKSEELVRILRCDVSKIERCHRHQVKKKQSGSVMRKMQIP